MHLRTSIHSATCSERNAKLCKLMVKRRGKVLSSALISHNYICCSLDPDSCLTVTKKQSTDPLISRPNKMDKPRAYKQQAYGLCQIKIGPCTTTSGKNEEELPSPVFFWQKTTASRPTTAAFDPRQ